MKMTYVSNLFHWKCSVSEGHEEHCDTCMLNGQWDDGNDPVWSVPGVEILHLGQCSA